MAEVAIVGGGPVGMGLAIELGQRGVSCVVLERHAEPQPIPRGQNLTQRTMEHFMAWGCEAEVRAARTIPPGYGIGGMTSYGTLISGWHYDWLQREKVRPYYFTDNERLPQYRTEAVLRARAAEIPGVEIRHGRTVTGLMQDAGGVTVTAQGPEGTEEIRAAYAVGCDGARSVTREAAGIGQVRRDHDRLMVLIVFRSEALHELLKRYPDKQFYCVLHPDLQGYWLFFGRVDLGSTWFFHAPVPAGTTAENLDFEALLHRAIGQEVPLSIQHLGFWDLRIAIAETYRAGRIFLAGDAAHSHPPYGGYGINTGFEDARNLGWKLAAGLRGWGGEALLESYDAERRPVFASTARDFIERFIESDRAFLSRFSPERDLAEFEQAWASRNAAAAEVNAFAPHYEGSGVVLGPPGGVCSAVGSHDFAARAGHHLPPAELTEGALPDRLGPGFTLIALATDPTPFETAARGLGIPLAVIRDDRCRPRDGWGPGLLLVRPDWYVAWTGETCAEAERVLRVAAGRS